MSDIIIKLPPKTQKPKYNNYGKSPGYRCPICRGSSERVKNHVGCGHCIGGVIRNREKWTYLRLQQLIIRYAKKFPNPEHKIRWDEK